MSQSNSNSTCGLVYIYFKVPLFKSGHLGITNQDLVFLYDFASDNHNIHGEMGEGF